MKTKEDIDKKINQEEGGKRLGGWGAMLSANKSFLNSVLKTRGTKSKP